MYSLNKQYVNDQEFTFVEVTQKNIKVKFMDYGATIVDLFVPDKHGTLENVVMSYKSLSSYLENNMYLNAIVGPTAGRIRDAAFPLNGKTIQLDKNVKDLYNLHGGKETFSFRFFDVEVIEKKDKTKVIFTLENNQEESLYPGDQSIKIMYTVTEGEVLIEYEGTTTEDTLLNLTNHAYFNLAGNMKDTIMNHELYVNSIEHIVLDENVLPLRKANSKGTHLDFTTKKPVKDNFFEGIYDIPQKGIDEPFLVQEVGFEHKQVELVEPISKRKLEVYTTYPAIVVYTHNYPDDEQLAYDVKTRMHLGICFEAQFVPDGINLEGVDKAILRKNELYQHKTLFKFSVED